MTLKEYVSLYQERIKPGMVVKRSKAVDNLIVPREGVYCRCNPAPWYTPRHSGRYPWKDDNDEIREVFNMDSNRLNRFVTLVNAVGGSFRIDQSICERSMVHIDIPCDMLHHLHIDGDGSVGPQAFSGVCVPAICDIQTFNDRAVRITFADGSQTKCVCGKDETFDLYEGIAFCLFKRALGKEDGHKLFNGLMRYAMKTLDEQEKAKEREAEIKAEKKRHEEKKKLQTERRKARKREEQIGVYQEAIKRDREAMLADGWVARAISYPADEPNPYIAPGEPEPPAKTDEKATDGSTLFLDPLSGETFISSKDKILLAMVTLNKRILEHGWVSVNEWYEELGLDSSGNLGESMGWTPDHLMRIDFADYVTRDGRECLAIVYDEKPVGYGEG